jgi:hypothetical protein
MTTRSGVFRRMYLVRDSLPEAGNSALEKLPEGAFDVARYRVVVRAGFAGVGQEGFEVFLDQAVERGLLGPPGFVDCGEGWIQVFRRSFHADMGSKVRAGRGISGVLP